MGIPEELLSVLADVEAANRDLARAMEASDAPAVSLALARVTAAEKRRNLLVHRNTRAVAPSYRAQVPIRDQVVAALKVVNRPTSVKLLADIARVLNEAVIDTRGLASVRRDEMRSWVLAHQEPPRATPRDPYIVPTLSADRFVPVRGVLSLSDAPAHLRFVGPRSPRVDLLNTMTVLASVALANTNASASGLTQLIAGLARDLRGASIGNVKDPQWVINAAREELSLIGSRDLDDRTAAADRALKQLSDVDFLFGAGANDVRVRNMRSIA
jgi:hypothetical protein